MIKIADISFKLRLELNKIDFVLSSPKFILSLLSTSQSEILLKSLVNCFYFSDTLMMEEQASIICIKYKSRSAVWLISLT